MADNPPPDHTNLPTLTPLATLPCPHNARGAGPSSRAWQATPHPSPYAPLLAVASADKSVYIWSLRNFRMVSKIEGGHKRSVRCVEWKDYGEEPTRDSKKRKVTLATGSFDANVGVWEHSGGRRRQRGWGAAAATSAEFSGDATMDVDQQDQDNDNDQDQDQEPPSDNDEAQSNEEWNFTTLLTGPDSEIKSMHFSPPHYSTNLLATSSRDKSVWVWEEVEDEEWETIAVLQEHTGDVKCVRWCEGVTLHDQSTGENRVVGSRELLASSSYDDTIRLWRDVEEEGDWTCISLLDGHAGTVWDLSWEKWVHPALTATPDWEGDWEPRLISCSDDLSLRVWRRELSDTEREKRRNARNTNGAATGISQRLPSIIRPTGHFETWVQQEVLPEVHVRSVYAVDWSRRTGLVVSCGGDGRIVVYREIEVADSRADGDIEMVQEDEAGAEQQEQPQKTRRTEWTIVAMTEDAHDEYEVNHVCWATRRDPEARFPDEEVIVSTGDEGDVKIWVLPDEILSRGGQ